MEIKNDKEQFTKIRIAIIQTLILLAIIGFTFVCIISLQDFIVKVPLILLIFPTYKHLSQLLHLLYELNSYGLCRMCGHTIINGFHFSDGAKVCDECIIGYSNVANESPLNK